MTGLLRKATLLACCLVFASSNALAAVPSPADSTIPCGINLVGTTGGVADAQGMFTIVVRDLAQNPIAGSSVVIDFDACTPDIQICSVQPVSGVTADCLTEGVGEVTAVTDGSGTVMISIVGGANNTFTNAPAAGSNCGIIFADGVNLGPVNVGAFDQNGSGGVNPADVSVWLADSFDGDLEGRSDFNCAGGVNPADLSVLLGVSLGGGSATSCGSYCL
jgi:hypothetical protein